VTVREFNRVMRAMGQAALESEAALAVVYERGLAAMGRYYASLFANTVLTAAADWVPPAGAPEFDSERALAASREQREEAARAIEDAFRRGVNDLAISFDPADFQIFSPDLLVSLGQHAGANFDAAGTKALGEVVAESFNAGLSVPDTAKAIRARFADVSRSSATMLARTDLIGLANGGSHMAARKVFENRPEVTKEWLNAHDARVRPTHAEAGGQEVPLDGAFRVGGFDLMYPGDPQGPPQEVINCRCTFTVGDGLTASADTREAEMAVDVATGTRWRSVLVLEGVETDDGRLIDPGALDWRDLPLSLMAMTETGPGGHEGAGVAGRIDQIARNSSTNEVIGEGVFDSGDFGAEVERLVADEMLTGVSVDLAIREYELRGEDGQPLDEEDMFDPEARVIFAVTDASIMGATVCPFPAFADATIELLASGVDRPYDRARMTVGFSLRSTEGPLVEEDPRSALGRAVMEALAATESAITDLREKFAAFSRAGS
jgi:Phage Mu protein F like protein